MPPLTRWYIKTALVYFILALTAGLLLALPGSLAGVIQSLGLFPVYIHLLVEGWITFLIIGVAYWMFPKASRERPRGSESLGWASYVLLNAGLILRVIGEPLNSQAGGSISIWGYLLAVSALLQWLGGMAFVVNTWGRVKEK
jgi:Trk-type K+ transport system membrane component